MERKNVLHRQMGDVCLGYPTGQAGAEQGYDACYRTESLSATSLVRALQAQVHHCLEVQRDGRSHHGSLRQVLGQREPRCASITTYLKLSLFELVHTA